MPVTREDLLLHVCNLIEYGIVIDTETTGLGDGDSVAELAAVRVKDRSVLIDTLVVPNSTMGDAAYGVHGITAVEASAGGITITDAINQLHAKACALPIDKRIISAYNLPFDQRLITQSLHLEDDSNFAGIPFPMRPLTSMWNLPMLTVRWATVKPHWLSLSSWPAGKLSPLRQTSPGVR